MTRPVPTEPGWWWRDDEENGPTPVAIWRAVRGDDRLWWEHVPDDGEPESYHVLDDGRWLAPVAPPDAAATLQAIADALPPGEGSVVERVRGLREAHDEAMRILDAGRESTLDGAEVPTTLVERARNVATALAAEADEVTRRTKPAACRVAPWAYLDNDPNLVVGWYRWFETPDNDGLYAAFVSCWPFDDVHAWEAWTFDGAQTGSGEFAFGSATTPDKARDAADAALRRAGVLPPEVPDAP